MLISYSVSNFKSINSAVEFDMKPIRVENRFNDNVYIFGNRLKLQKTAVIVGENAGGKSNFFESMDYFKQLFMSSNIRNMYMKSVNHNHKEDFVRKYEISVVGSDNRIYDYTLELDQISIVNESLERRGITTPKEKSTKLFWVKRKKAEWMTENRIDVAYDAGFHDSIVPLVGPIVSGFTNNSGTVLMVMSLNTIGIDEVKPFVEWVIDKVEVELPDSVTYDRYKRVKEDEHDLTILKTEEYFSIFRLVDSTISGLDISDTKPFDDSLIIRMTDDGDELKVPIKEESNGVREFFAWATAIYKVIHEQKTIFADEVDRVLNVILSERILRYINATATTGQFIFSTHNIFHLNTNDYLKDQLYFITKEESTLSTELYSLADFEDYRYGRFDVYNLYLKGILGGTPNG